MRIQKIDIDNLSGKRVKIHFGCGHNISNDRQLMMTLRSIGGLPLEGLLDDERETAALAIEAGYILKENDILYPRIVVMEKAGLLWNFVDEFINEISGLAGPVADDMYGFIKKMVPEHLMGEWEIFPSMTSCGLLGSLIEKSIELGTLTPPERTPGPEGVMMTVTK